MLALSVGPYPKPGRLLEQVVENKRSRRKQDTYLRDLETTARQHSSSQGRVQQDMKKPGFMDVWGAENAGANLHCEHRQGVGLFTRTSVPLFVSVPGEQSQELHSRSLRSGYDGFITARAEDNRSRYPLHTSLRCLRPHPPPGGLSLHSRWTICFKTSISLSHFLSSKAPRIWKPPRSISLHPPCPSGCENSNWRQRKPLTRCLRVFP